MRFLRANTAIIVEVGPFLGTDGVTLKTSLTITNERITLTSSTDAGSAPTLALDNITGATSGTANDLNYITGQDNAMMQIEIAAANIATAGRYRMTITDASNHLPVIEDFMVLDAFEYDCLYSSLAQKLRGAFWYGTLSALADTTFTLPGGHGISHEAQIQITLTGGTNAVGKSRLASYSGSGEVYTVDPAWNSDSETTPTGTLTGIVVSVAKSPTTSVPYVQMANPAGFKKNTAVTAFTFPMEDEDGALVTGLTVTATRSLDGGSFASCANSVSEIGSTGVYKITLATTDMNGDIVALKFTGTGALDRVITIQTEP